MPKIDTKKVAKLANLPLSTEEEQLYQKQLEDILAYVEQIEDKVKASDVEPIFNVSTAKNIKAKDNKKNSLSQQQALQNASSKKNGFFLTKGVFADE